MSSMIEVCRQLSKIGYIGESSVYTCANEKKYLLLSEVDYREASELNEFSFIAEYGNYERSKDLDYYLSEHGISICEHDAVSKFSKL